MFNSVILYFENFELNLKDTLRLTNPSKTFQLATVLLKTTFLATEM